MKRIAFVFKNAPHGSSGGREGLDALLATSNYTEQVAAFFVSDGVWQLLPGQQPDQILARDYIATFKVLPLYDIDEYYVCAEDMAARGLSPETPYILPVICLDSAEFARKLATFDIVLSF
ncbi:sulfurtransferase complex subunit TusC [Morganella psychrotolerans]|uniref:sulfurtransferase complex subunit TusC n=1 Tax=Morganella psychrotolerans TaxID=368603 RepID=UPI0039AF7D65